MNKRKNMSKNYDPKMHTAEHLLKQAKGVSPLPA
jgi:hypothetical protein